MTSVVSNQPVVLTQRVLMVKSKEILCLPLSAHERTKLRGLRTTTCGLDVLLQLPRLGPLTPGEILIGENEFPFVKVEAAKEELIQVEASSALELAKASYHLGNRHVDLELEEQKLFLLKDPVLELMLKKRGLNLQNIRRPFYPENGAYSDVNIPHSHQ